ncbi:uncharacterized protein MAM_03071 [Metarhizium album ARSEF 1941]|uniref:Uncharacterized protein n=1 Tax=Metarhizium album (strain ARSEF 1941) TaxID=1081103 RepID=A0A0B2WZB3_METAS|nr:uncharacterized protein MAM_03071 [Metarhizium album ARSEF 1941]KHN99373.1 hypothetical protein MAM_03071 [Metarhizium album ARSEF 1941]
MRGFGLRMESASEAISFAFLMLVVLLLALGIIFCVGGLVAGCVSRISTKYCKRKRAAQDPSSGNDSAVRDGGDGDGDDNDNDNGDESFGWDGAAPPRYGTWVDEEPGVGGRDALELVVRMPPCHHRQRNGLDGW